MKTVITVVLTLVALKLLVIWLEPRLAFFPVSGVQATPASMSLSFVDLRIPTADGETLHGWWLEHPEPRAQVVFWHGNGGNLSLWLEVIVELRRRGFSVLAVDYRGYGLSTGRPSEQGLYRDAAATIEAFGRRLQRPGTPVLFWGRSIGCPVAASTLHVQRPTAIVLESPMPDVRSVLRTNPVMWLLSFLSSYRFSTSQFLADYDGPLLVIHGDSDSIVPFAAGQRVFRDARSARGMFVTIPGGDHNDHHVVAPDVYWQGIDKFVAGIDPMRAGTH